MAQSTGKAQQELTSIRDTVESIWVAIVLAFVLRAFVVEAFVIPTGSMAPRLLGEHLDLRCPACGYEYAFGWSSDQERRGRDDAESVRRWGRGAGGDRTPEGARCPTCGYDEPPPSPEAGGDRVLVMKYLYRFRPPEPWDVVVFKNPQDNRQNYIKRLIGLPGETIEIVHGDVFVSTDRGTTFRIRRKERPKTQEAMWQVVFDNGYLPSQSVFAHRNAAAHDDGREPIAPPRWVPEGLGGWDPCSVQSRQFIFQGGPEGAEAGLVFQGDEGVFLPRYGYNSSVEIDHRVDIVSDLNLAVTYFPKAGDSRLILSLSSFEYVFRGEISADGRARLVYRDLLGTVWIPLADDVEIPPLKPGRGYQVALTNVDLRAALWVDGQRILVSRDQADGATAKGRAKYPLDYASLKERVRLAKLDRGGRPIPTPQVRIAASGGACELRHVKLLRDVYYTCPVFRDGPPPGPSGQLARAVDLRAGQPGWAVTGNPIQLTEFPGRPDLNQYFVLGDNSPSSLDGRLWSSAAPTLHLRDEETGEQTYKLGTVPRYSLIGKAVFVYWPAGFPVPGLPHLPIIPNVGKMRLIR